MMGTRCWEDPALGISGLEKVTFQLIFEDEARACRQPLWYIPPVADEGG